RPAAGSAQLLAAGCGRATRRCARGSGARDARRRHGGRVEELRLLHGDLPRGAAGHPRIPLRGRSDGRGGRVAQVHERHAAAALEHARVRAHLRPHRSAPGLRPDLRHDGGWALRPHADDRHGDLPVGLPQAQPGLRLRVVVRAAHRDSPAEHRAVRLLRTPREGPRMTAVVTRAAATRPARTRIRPASVATFLVMLLVTAFVLLPVAIIVLTAFKPTAEVNAYPPTLVPTQWTVDNLLQIG